MQTTAAHRCLAHLLHSEGSRAGEGCLGVSQYLLLLSWGESISAFAVMG